MAKRLLTEPIFLIIIMKLLCDDRNRVFVWVDDTDEKIVLSPHFDYEEDALLWRERQVVDKKEIK